MAIQTVYLCKSLINNEHLKTLKKNRYLPGKTKEQAFAIGNEIAALITAQNPAPIKLKFEKVI